ncbi:MAG: secondary thiamine-phosphate synthase enzyme YjbQ [Candidatus Falkowbacteria bacterium]
MKLKTSKELEFINITNQVRNTIKDFTVKEGILNIFSKHTTLAIKINEYEPLLLKDMEWFMKKLAPEKRKYFHDSIKLRKNCPKNEPANAKGHLRSMLMETFQTIPIIDDKIQLGKYQQIFAVETSGPREREIIIQIFGESSR